jgi:beta-glucanase (GH16 family)
MTWLLLSQAAPFTSSIETESGNVGVNASIVTDAMASGGQAVRFAAEPSGCTFLDTILCSKELSWSDEFNDTVVDTAKWTARDNSNYGSGNNEDECYFSDNVTESGGVLKIAAKRETVSCGGTNPDTGNNTYYFTSGFLKGNVDFVHGYYEASIKMPKGTPYWGAFWLTGGTGAPGWPDYGEFDVMEVVGVRPDTTFGTYHWGCNGTTQCQSSPQTFNLLTQATTGGSSDTANQLTASNFATYTGVSSSRFVRYGFLWEANKMTWYVDGHKVRSFDGNQLVRYASNGTPTVEKTYGSGWYDGNPASPAFSTVMNYKHILNLNLAIGGGMAQYWGYTGEEGSGSYTNGNFAANMPENMEVDYVRVYQ